MAWVIEESTNILTCQLLQRSNIMFYNYCIAYIFLISKFAYILTSITYRVYNDNISIDQQDLKGRKFNMMDYIKSSG
jgi:hypothetical protein